MPWLRRYAGAIIGLLLSLAGAAYGVRYLQETYLQEITTVQVPVPQTTIPPFTPLRAEQFSIRSLPAGVVTDEIGYVVSLEALVGGVITTGNLPAGLPVPAALLAHESQYLGPVEEEKLSLAVSPAMSVAGQLEVGQRVNIYFLGPPGGEREEGAAAAAWIAQVTLRGIYTVEGAPRSSEAFEPVGLIVISALPQTVREIISALAEAETGAGELLITLAPFEEGVVP